jgi:hypothetical protein
VHSPLTGLVQLMLWQPILLQEQRKGTILFLQEQLKGAILSRVQPVPKLNSTCVSVEPRPDVAVHALVIPDVPPAGSHPWS